MVCLGSLEAGVKKHTLLTSGSFNVDADVFWSGNADGAKASACAPDDPVHGNPSTTIAST